MPTARAGESVPQFSIEQQLAEVRREISLRETVYPDWIRRGRLHADRADRQIALMRAVARTLEGIAATGVGDLFGST